MRFILLSTVWLVCAQLHAQSSPEEAAIAEILTAKDFADVEKHLPEQLQTALDAMNKIEREQLLSKPRAMMVEKGLKVSQSSDGQALIAFDVEVSDAAVKHFEIRTRRRVSNGAEAVLVLACISPERNWGNAEVWMKLEQGEWRVTELTDPNGYGKINLEDAETIAQIAPTSQQKNEHTAVAALHALLRAVFVYNARYSQLPEKIEVLGGGKDRNPGAEEAFIADAEFATEHVAAGYRFAYHRTSADSFQISATPLQFGKTGGRNFLVDESGMIRFTDEDREATVNDHPLETRQVGY